MAVVGMAANPSEPHQAGCPRAGQILAPACREAAAEGACGWAARLLPVEICIGEVRNDLLQLGTPSIGSIEGSGIATSRACRIFEGFQASCQSDDQCLLLLDRSAQLLEYFW
jgi:hypothetical protein